MLDRAIAVSRFEADEDTEGQLLRLRRTMSQREASVQPHARRHRGLFRPIAVAVGGACVVAATLLLVTGTTDLEYRTSMGERLTVILPDSSEVQLNHGTTIRYSRGILTRTRSVSMQGEAFFHVRSDATPFEVSAPLGTVRVVGTAFNVVAQSTKLEVGVTSGVVRLLAGGAATTVAAGYAAAFDSGGQSINLRPISRSLYPPWIHGVLQFDRTTVAEACRQIEELFGVSIRIADPSLAAVPISGQIDASSPGNAVQALCLLMNTHYRHENGSYLLY